MVGMEERSIQRVRMIQSSLLGCFGDVRRGDGEGRLSSVVLKVAS